MIITGTVIGNASNHWCQKQHYNLQLSLQIRCECVFFSVEIVKTNLNTPIWKAWGCASRAQRPLPNTGSPWISVLWVNARQVTITDINLHTFRPGHSRPSLFSSATNWKSVTDFVQDVACCTCPYHMSCLPTAKGWRNILGPPLLTLKAF